jgi:glycosidase
MTSLKKISLTLFAFLSVATACKEDPIVQQVEEPLIIPASEVWWNDDVFYEIFVRSFYDSDGNGVGDFQGIIQKLDYLNDGDPSTESDLGVTALWLMPIFSSPSYHGYDITDYRSVNSQYGTMSDFKQLVSEAHKRGIRIIIDFVINHTSDQHSWFASSASGNAAKRDWYVWSGTNPGYKGPWGQTVWHERNGSFYYGVFGSSLPDLNVLNTDVTAEIKDIATYWYNETGIDGFRVDAARVLIANGEIQEDTPATLGWWRKFFAFQKNLDPALMTVGEVWTNTAQVVPYTDQRFDYCFEFDLSYAIINAVRSASKTALIGKMREIVNAYPTRQFGSFLTNHDQNRVIEELALDVEKAKVAAGILLTLPGIPYLYYGDEVGMMGKKPDEDIRRPMQWSDAANAGFTSGSPWRSINSNYPVYNVAKLQQAENSLWNNYRRLIKARTSNSMLSEGSFEEVSSNFDFIFSFLRVKSGKGVLVVHNLSALTVKDTQLSFAASSLAAGTYSIKDLLTNKDLGTLTIGSNGSLPAFTLPETLPYSSQLLALERL